jgi:TolB protein
MRPARLLLAAVTALLADADPARADERPPIVVSDPTAKAYRAAVQRFLSPDGSADAALVGRVRESLQSGLEFSGLFSRVSDDAFLGPKTSVPLDGGAPVVCDNWRQIGSDALVEGEMRRGRDGLRAEFRVLDVQRGCLGIRRKHYKVGAEDASRLGKAIADDVVEAFTGKAGVADTEIAFISNRGGSKEVYVMDADGQNTRAATRNRSINSFPAWSPDGNDIVYTSYRHRGRPFVFLLSRGRPSPGRILTSFDSGAQLYRAVFDPSGRRLAIVTSANGASEIYVANRDGGGTRRLTQNRNIDVSPSWSPDGSRIAFVSDRTGAPQVYVMNADGSNQQRLTFDGSYNTNPAWSPDGRWIAYETRLGGQFDLWLIDPAGSVNVPLVSHPRSDEHPSWAPDGRKLAFSSTRRGRADIYVVDLGSEDPQRVASGGENVNPAWGPYRRR